MPKSKRNIGLEILQGLRELKRGEHGRVTTVPSVASIREKTELSQSTRPSRRGMNSARRSRNPSPLSAPRMRNPASAKERR